METRSGRGGARVGGVMSESPLKQMTALGQSLWLDYIRRDLMANGGLRHLIEEDGLRGLTSNPAIFKTAIADSHDYDDDIRVLFREGKTTREIYESLSQYDVRSAADEFRNLYESTDGREGYVSLEVNPHLARDTQGTMEEARRLWKSLDRPNVFIKVPATLEGLPAIQQLIREGININATLIFGQVRYTQVAKAYIAGVEERLAEGKSLRRLASVASFFVSRIDTMVDPLLDPIIQHAGTNADTARSLKGGVATASAKLAYQDFKGIFGSCHFADLEIQGARKQRLLWASTGTKNPEYRDVKYVEALIGPDTINTVPLDTLDAFRDHGRAQASLEADLGEAQRVMDRLAVLRINIDRISQQLEAEGIQKFIQPFDQLMDGFTRALPKPVKDHP